jgi:hypothetical protein
MSSLRNCQFSFKCDKKWDSLEATSSSGRKFCGDCKQFVYLCLTDRELSDHIRENHCIAIASVIRNKDFDTEVGIPFEVDDQK